MRNNSETDVNSDDLLALIDKIVGNAIKSENSDDLEKAEKVFGQVVALFPDILLKYGILLSDRSKIDEAIDIFKKVVYVKPSSLAFNNLACCYAKKGDTLSAIDNFKKAVESDPDNIDTIVNLAGLYYQSDQYDEAIKLYEEILNILPSDIESLLMISNCYFKQGNYESAVIGFQSVLRFDPGNEDAKMNLQKCLSLN